MDQQLELSSENQDLTVPAQEAQNEASQATAYSPNFLDPLEQTSPSISGTTPQYNDQLALNEDSTTEPVPASSLDISAEVKYFRCS